MKRIINLLDKGNCTMSFVVKGQLDNLESNKCYNL